MFHILRIGLGYSKEDLKIHTWSPSLLLPFLPLVSPHLSPYSLLTQFDT